MPLAQWLIFKSARTVDRDVFIPLFHQGSSLFYA